MSDPIAVSRRLVAVFAAELEGYSRLMGADEVGTLKGLTERRDEFIWMDVRTPKTPIIPRLAAIWRLDRACWRYQR